MAAAMQNGAGGSAAAVPSASAAASPFVTSPQSAHHRTMPGSSSKAAAAVADPFDAIVQAANPAHPDHAAWKERFGGSMRSLHRHLDDHDDDDDDGGLYSQPSAARGSGSVRRSRSKTGSKTSAKSPRPRRSLDGVTMRPKSRLPSNDSFPSPPAAASERRSPSEQEIIRRGSRQHMNKVAGNRDETKATDGVGPDESPLKRPSSSTARRRKKKDKGKGKAAAPPIPPPRTTSHAAAQHESKIDSPNVLSYEGTAVYPADTASLRSGLGMIGSPATVALASPALSQRQFSPTSASAPTSPSIAFYPASLRQPHRLPSQVLEEPGVDSFGDDRSLQDRAIEQTTLGNHEERLRGYDGSASTSFGALKHIVNTPHSDLPYQQTSNTSDSPSPTKGMFAPPTAVLAGRRSVDFRLPQDSTNGKASQMRSESRFNQRRGLDSLFAPIRNAVSGRKADKLASASSATTEPKAPTPILRQGQLPISEHSVAQTAPTPPPRSPLRAVFQNAPVYEHQKDLTNGLSIVRPEVADSGSAHIGSPDVAEPRYEPKDVSGTALGKDLPEEVQQGNLEGPESNASRKDTQRKSASQEVEHMSHSHSHSLSISVETEDGQEFHDAQSDEGGNGSSEADALRMAAQPEADSPASTRRRRSKLKSMASPNIQRESASLKSPQTPLIGNSYDNSRESNFLQMNIPESSSSEDHIPVALHSPRSNKNRHHDSAARKTIPTQDQDLPRDTLESNFLHMSLDKGEGETSDIQLPEPSETTNALAPEQSQGAPASAGPPTEIVDTKYANKHLPSPPTPHLTDSGGVTPRFGDVFAVHSTTSVGLPSPRDAQTPLTERGGEPDLASFVKNEEGAEEKSSPVMPFLSPSNSDNRSLKNEVSQKRSFSNPGSGGFMKKTGIFSRVRRDKTPSQPHLRQTESFAPSIASNSSKFGSQTHLPTSTSNDSHWAEQSTTGSVGLGIENAMNRGGNDSAFEPQRRASNDGGWRTRLPSFSAGKASKHPPSAWQGVTESSPPLPPLPTSPSSASTTDEDSRRRMLYDAIARSFSHESPASGDPRAAAIVQSTPPLLEPSTIHKTLSPALLTETRHEADEVGSFIGSSDAEEERLADSKRGTWNSFRSFELAPNKTHDDVATNTGHAQIGESRSTKSNDVLQPAPIITEPPQSEERKMLSSTTDGASPTPLSMTTRRISRSASHPKLANAPKALNLSSPNRMTNDVEYLDDSQSSPFLRSSPDRQRFPTSASGGISFSPVGTGPRQRNHSLGSTLFGAAAKGRSSFAADRDRSPVVNQIWADLPPSPSPAAATSAVRKFFAKSGKGILRGKQRNASNGALRSPGFTVDGEDALFASGMPMTPTMYSSMATEHRPSEDALMNQRTPGMTSAQTLQETPVQRRAHTPATDGRATPGSQSMAMPAMVGGSTSTTSLHSGQSGLAVSRVEGNRRTSIESTRADTVDLGSRDAHARGIEIVGSDRSEGPSPNFDSVRHTASLKNLSASLSSPIQSPPALHHYQHRLDAASSTRSISSSTSATHSSSNATTVEREAFDRMLRARAKEDAHRIRQIAQRSASAMSAPNTPALPTSLNDGDGGVVGGVSGA